MQGIDATIGEFPPESRPDSVRLARHLILGAVAAATIGAVAAYALHVRYAAPPAAAAAHTTPVPAPEDPVKLFGAIIVEPEWRNPPADAAAFSTMLASLGPETLSPSALFPPPSREAAAPPPLAAAKALPDVIPLPPVRAVPRIDDTAPLPPARPPEFAEPAPTLAPSVAQPAAPPPDERNVFQKLLGIGQPPGAVIASRPPAPAPVPAAPAPSRPASTPEQAAPALPPAARSGEGRSGFAALFGGFSSTGSSLDRLGYDRQTAIYDISARALYLPDGTRLEAHSGLGAALDDLRYVGERAVGPTPPHLYELTMRESLFHGVQAIRLTPVGEGDVFGRAGLLAHPYMLGPNGDSNGCVSVKDYAAFLRAYQNGQINKLAVVARI